LQQEEMYLLPYYLSFTVAMDIATKAIADFLKDK
jgi:hypothetical protein